MDVDAKVANDLTDVLIECGSDMPAGLGKKAKRALFHERLHTRGYVGLLGFSDGKHFRVIKKGEPRTKADRLIVKRMAK